MSIAMRAFVILAFMSGALFSTAMAQDVRNETVRFPRGQSGTTIEHSITGYESVRYSIGVSAGQTMSVQLDSDNASNFFNITAPGAREAVYNGSVSGNGTSLVIPSSGNYIIDVYLTRNGARRGDTANYELTLYVENAARKSTPSTQRPSAPEQNGTPSQVDTSQMPRFCAGEASAKFGPRPQEITVNMAFQSGNQFVAQGYFDRDGQTTFFNCWFGLDGRFQSVN